MFTRRRLAWSAALALLAGLINPPALSTSAAAAGDCELYPIALPADAVVSATAGAELQLPGGAAPGSFGWLSWTGTGGEPALVTSLTPPGDSHTYRNPADPADATVSVGDDVRARPGVVASARLRQALTDLAQREITLPVWDAASGSGAGATYRVAGFARATVLGLDSGNSAGLTVRYLGAATCGAPVPERALVLDAERLRVREVGSSVILGAFLEDGGTRTAVTIGSGATWTSSNPAVVVAEPDGRLRFQAAGVAQVTVRYDGLSAVAHVDVDPAGTPAVTAQVGQLGGRVALPGGPAVDIPAGALSTPQVIGVEESTVPAGSLQPDDGTPVGPAFDFTPHGLTFATPIEITMPYDPLTVPAALGEEALLALWLTPAGDWVIDGPAETDQHDHSSVAQGVDVARDVVDVTTDHFSRRQLTVAGVTSNPVTLRAPDGTELQVFQHLKQQVTCGTVAVPVPARPATSTVDYIVLHNTANASTPPTTRFTGEVRHAADAATCTGAHYYVDKDGTIVQVYEDDQVARHIGYNGPDPDDDPVVINRDNSIGIEIFNNHCGPGSTPTVCADPENYPGAQMSAVVRLTDFLLRNHPSTARPDAAGRGGIRMHAEIATNAANARTDPEGQFRTAVMGAPSLEQVLYQSLRTEHTGLIRTVGGDGLGAFEGGDGGDVLLEYGDPTLENAPDQSRGSLVVPAGSTTTFTGATDRMHVLIEGELVLTRDTTLDVDGTFYVAPAGRITATGSPLAKDGHSLTVIADGTALIEGVIDTSGHDSTFADGDGGAAGNVTFRTAAPGPAHIPTLVTRGGDADSVTDNAALKAGGDGGSVIIRARQNLADDRVQLRLQGSDNIPADRLPPPAPFNQMPVVVAGAPNPPAEFQCQRPVSGERLPLGRDSTGANISAFRRGILTVGGMGGASDVTSRGTGGPGGRGGRIEISNDTQGALTGADVALFTGAGVEELCYKITVAAFGGPAIYGAPSGGLGGKGSLNSGAGGRGGDAGPISLHSATPLPAPTPATPVLGHDSENPVELSHVPLGQLRRINAPDGTTAFTFGTVGGSGGSPGGSASGFPGRFGPKGSDGTVLINGQPVP